MSVNLGVYTSAVAVQDALSNNKFVQFDPTAKRTISPLIRILTSSINTTGVIQRQIARGGGQKASVDLIYQPRLLESSVSSTPLDACSTGDKNGDLSTSYDIDKNSGSWAKGTIDVKTDLVDAVFPHEYYVQQKIRSLMDAVYRSMATKSFAEISALVGNHASTGNATAITGATKDSNGNLSDDLISKMTYDLSMMEVEGITPFAVGGSQDWQRLQNALGYTCCTSALNFDLNEYNRAVGVAPVFDYRAETQWGAGSVYMIVPGALQLVSFNANGGAAVADDDTYKSATIMDPETGVMFDYEAKYDCGVWTFSLGLAHEVFGMPPDMFQTGDRLEGVNYVSEFEISNS
jgi:hypothetical protein